MRFNKKLLNSSPNSSSSSKSKSPSFKANSLKNTHPALRFLRYSPQSKRAGRCIVSPKICTETNRKTANPKPTQPTTETHETAKTIRQTTETNRNKDPLQSPPNPLESPKIPGKRPKTSRIATEIPETSEIREIATTSPYPETSETRETETNGTREVRISQ